MFDVPLPLLVNNDGEQDGRKDYVSEEESLEIYRKCFSIKIPWQDILAPGSTFVSEQPIVHRL